jgi:hypothetical protein
MPLNNPPKTLQEWRHSSFKEPQDQWNELQSFFAKEGFTLWTQSRLFTLQPPNQNKREKDRIVCAIEEYQDLSKALRFSQTVSPVHG